MRALLALLLVLATAAGAAAAGSAPRAWPGTAIGYRDLTGAHGYHGAVREAVAAWNRLGLGVRFVPAAPGQSAVQIAFASGRCLRGDAGRAPTGFQRFGARVLVRSCPEIVRPLLVAHELGRVLGLTDDDRACSLMNSKGRSDGRTFAAPARCSRYLPPAWLPRLVDPLTAARARALYAAPTPAADVRFTPGPQPRLDWRQPAGSSRRTLVLRTGGRCPTRADAAGHTGAAVVYSEPSYAGLHWAVDTTVGSAPGRVCYRLFAVSAAGRATPSQAFPYVPPTLVPAAAVVATAGTTVTFADRSTDPGAQIVHWRWDFGDGAVLDTTDPAAGRTPSHTYASAGAYTVTLTVSDSVDRSATMTLAVAAG